MYVIVRCGGRQEKVSVDDVLTVDKLAGDVGSTVTLPAVLVVDDDNVVSDPAEVGRYEVTAEIMGAEKGPKISMVLYKNKTGYRRRLGHRQHYTQVRITEISDGQGGGAKSSKASTARASTSKASTSKASASKASASKASASKTSASKASSSRAGTSKAGTSKSGASKAGASSRKKA